MEKALCETCQSAKTAMRCGLCELPACKTCAHLFEEDAFSFLPVVPAHLTKGVYCNVCYEAKVSADVAAYNKTMEAARNIDMYYKDQGKETRLIRRKEAPFSIKTCEDRDEIILRLAFLCAHAGFPTLVDVDVIGDKVRTGSYQKTNYRATAIPVENANHQIPRDRSIRHNPN